MAAIGSSTTSMPATNAAQTGGATGTATTTDAPASAATQAAGAAQDAEAPSPDFPNLTVSHVQLLQVAATPPSIIAQINADKPGAEWLYRYIEGEIFQNPEGWDAYTGNPEGTTRASIKKYIPDAELPAPGQGKPGYVSDGSTVSGVDIPGLTQPLIDPQPTAQQQATQAGGGLITKLLIGVAVIGGGLLLWKHFKGAKNPVEVGVRNLPGNQSFLEQMGLNMRSSVGGLEGAVAGGGSLAAMYGNGGDHLTKLGQMHMVAGAAESSKELFHIGGTLGALGMGGPGSARLTGPEMAAVTQHILGGGMVMHPTAQLIQNMVLETGQSWETCERVVLRADAMASGSLGDLLGRTVSAAASPAYSDAALGDHLIATLRAAVGR